MIGILLEPLYLALYVVVSFILSVPSSSGWKTFVLPSELLLLLGEPSELVAVLEPSYIPPV